MDTEKSSQVNVRIPTKLKKEFQLVSFHYGITIKEHLESLMRNAVENFHGNEKTNKILGSQSENRDQ